MQIAFSLAFGPLQLLINLAEFSFLLTYFLIKCLVQFSNLLPFQSGGLKLPDFPDQLGVFFSLFNSVGKPLHSMLKQIFGRSFLLQLLLCLLAFRDPQLQLALQREQFVIRPSCRLRQGRLPTTGQVDLQLLDLHLNLVRQRFLLDKVLAATLQLLGGLVQLDLVSFNLLQVRVS